MQSTSASGRTLLSEEAGSSVAGLPAGERRWSSLVRLVAAEYPYCTMNGVHVVDGEIVACEAVQRSFTFGADDSAGAVEPAFDDQWKALEVLCAKVRSGRLAELRFSRGKPVSARTSEGGRRFRRILGKYTEGKHSRMS